MTPLPPECPYCLAEREHFPVDSIYAEHIADCGAELDQAEDEDPACR